MLDERVIRHCSSSVSFEVYQPMWRRVTQQLPTGTSVCFLADRRFVYTRLMRYLRDEVGRHFRIRIKSNSWIYRFGRGWARLNQYHLALGPCCFAPCSPTPFGDRQRSR